jgi:hypothetical protein
MGCSLHNVPSLSNVAIRSAGGTKSGPPFLVTFFTNCIMVDLLAPLFQDGNGSADLATATVANDKNTNNEMML